VRKEWRLVGGGDRTVTRRAFLPLLSFPALGGLYAPEVATAMSAGGIRETAERETMNSETSKRQAGIFLVRNYFMKNGSQPSRLHRFMQNALLPELQAVTNVPPVFLDAIIAPRMPQAMTVFGFESMEHWQAFEARTAASERYQASLAEWEQGDDPPYEEYSEALLAPTVFCPPLVASPSSQAAQVFELRIYHSPTHRQLAALNDRFAGPEIRIFHRCGILPILYTNGLSGDSLPNLTYLTPFESLATREKAWAGFGADPEWIKVRAASIEKSGQISAVMHISLWKAAAYSPIR
jgi:hypothetical protein